MRKKSIFNVAVLYPASLPWMAQCLDGIRAYAKAHGNWYLITSPPTLKGAGETALDVRSLHGWKGDALILATSDAEELRLARAFRLPMVNLAYSGKSNSPRIPSVMVDHGKAGALAADYLLKRGLRNLAFFGWEHRWYSERRQAGFTRRAATDGIDCEILLTNPEEEKTFTWLARMARIKKWLSGLNLPCGVFAAHDYRAQWVALACRECGLRIPEDIALIGMDNDATLCDHLDPTLTSVSRNSEAVGWSAAALLDRMMRGDPTPDTDILLEPDGIVERQSTGLIYCSDPLVRRALARMRQDLGRSFNVEQLALEMNVSKRTLEYRFRQHMRTSPHKLLTRLRVEQAKALIDLQENWKIGEVAAECGFPSSHAFRKAFENETGRPLSTLKKKKKKK